MTKLRRPVRLYVLGTILAAGVAIVAAALTSWGPVKEVGLALVLLVVATLAQIRVVHLSAKTKLSVGDTPIFTGVLLLPTPVAMLIAGASTFIGLRMATRQPLYNRAFNAAGSVLAAGAATAVFHALVAGPSLLDDPLAIAAAAVAYYVVKFTVTDVVVALQLRRDPRPTWWVDHRGQIGHHGALYLLGVLAAVSAQEKLWTLLLFLLPMALVLVTLRETTRLRQHTKDAIVELADLIDQRDPYTYGHSLRVAELSRRVATRLRLPSERVDLITEAARMHDIGKISTPDSILKKPGPLTEGQWVEMRRHCDAGHHLLLQLPDFSEGADLVHSHHERVDGTGYPRALRGVDLPLEASVIAVCDAYDAMTSDRVYRAALSSERVLAELRAGRGTQWHERAVDAMLALIEEGALAPTAAMSTAMVASAAK